MKKIIGVAFLILYIFLPWQLHAQENIEEYIHSMDVVLSVNTDSSVDVTETIVYDFGNEYRHGIHRDISLPTVVGSIDRIALQSIYVTDIVGTPYPVKLSKEGKSINLRIGDPNTMISGPHVYVISYKAHNAIGHFDDRDEIYWNVTGTEWEVPIQKASATVNIPASFEQSVLHLATYCGSFGATMPCNKGVVTTDAQATQVFFTTPIDFPFYTGEGMTVAVGFPIGLVARPTTAEMRWHWFATHWFYPFPIPIVILWFRKPFIYWRRRRAFYKNHTIIPEYDAGGMDPLEVSGIVKGQVVDRDLSAQIIYLATKGYLTISMVDKTYQFTRTDRGQSALNDRDTLLLNGIVGKNETELKNTFYTDAVQIKTMVSQTLMNQGYQRKIKKGSWQLTFILGLFFAVNPGAFVWIFVGNAFGFIWSVSCVLIAIFSLCTKSWTNSLTTKGLETEHKLLGLKRYIQVAEEDRIKFHNAPDKSPELFETLLPYAMVFGLEKEWAKEFESIYTRPPVWYQDSHMSNFSALAFASTMNNFSYHAQRSLFSRPASQHSSGGFSSGLSSGSSGGGSSGGGGGGGGGGSW